ncbi:MAG: hypothetical protein Q9183_003468 [Haloplaca sp. 2 TL-2023]
MAGLVDLSLFATSPTDDHHFAVDDLAINTTGTTTDRIFRARHGAATLDRHASPLPRCYTMKPLPPLPPRRLCGRRGSGSRPDFTSRCILTRMKRQREDDLAFTRGVSIQQRRNGTAVTAPQLTLTLPRASTIPSHHQRTASAMIWMPDEQMWLTADEITDQFYDAYHHDQHPPAADPVHQSAYMENTIGYYQPSYPRSEPSPGPYAYYDLTPPVSPESPESPVISQFRTLLVEPRDEERLSPLFQQAMQTVPPLDSASLYSQSVDEPEPEPIRGESRDSEQSRQESFHSAIEFLAGGPTRPHHREPRQHGGWASQARRLARPSSAMA